MNKRFAMFVVLLIVPMILAACGGGLSEDDAEKGIKAAFEGNRSEAEKYFCKEDLDKMGSTSILPEGGSVEPSCKKDGDKMVCTIKMTMTVPNAEPVSQEVTTNLNIKDGKLCGGDLAGGN